MALPAIPDMVRMVRVDMAPARVPQTVISEALVVSVVMVRSVDFYGEYRQAGSTSQESEQDLHMRAAANFINSGRYQEAMNVLNGINEHTAQWYYYSAIANSGLGNNVTALQHAKEALRMEPDNYQYQMLVNQFESGGSWYRQRQNPYTTTFGGGSDWCVKLCIANIVCNLCCGGGMCCGAPGGYTGGGGHYM